MGFPVARHRSVADLLRYYTQTALRSGEVTLPLERGQFKTNWEAFALDATTIEHSGKNYLV